MAEILFTVDEAARRLKMHPDTLRRQLRLGRIKSVRTGKLWRIPESAFSVTGENSGSQGTENLGVEGSDTSDETEIDELFAPPTPAEIAARLEAWANFGSSVSREEGASQLTEDAVAQSYDERAAQLMEGLR